jgi:hypothetical protein
MIRSPGRLADRSLLARLQRAVAADDAIRAGNALLEATKRVPPEDWEQWQRDNLKLSLETAAEYMKLATEQRGG